jgi:hypothetical protein
VDKKGRQCEIPLSWTDLAVEDPVTLIRPSIFGTFSLSWAVYRASISDGRERSCAPELLFRNACRLEIIRIAVFGVDPPYSFYLAAASATTFRELAAFSF